MNRLTILLAVFALLAACASKPTYPSGSFGQLIDDPNFSYWEDRHENTQTGDYIYEFSYQAASIHKELLQQYIERRANTLCPRHTIGKRTENDGMVSLCGDGTVLVMIDAEVVCE